MPHGPKLSYLPDFEGSEALYRRLDHGKLEVRVLTVWSNEDFSSPLEGNLEIRSLRDVLAKGRFYDALSYYWGSANDLDHVIIHGSDEGKPTISCEVPVTRNLTSALRHLRKKATAAGEPLGLWTDAICINQRDAQERYEQVGIMAGIFQGSRHVLVWLGDRNSSKLAGDGLRYVANVCDRFGVHEEKGNPKEERAAIYIADQGWDASQLVDSIEALMGLPYWRRGWILQEITAFSIPIILAFEDETCNLVGLDTFTTVLHAFEVYAWAHDLRPLGIPPLMETFNMINVSVLHASKLRRCYLDVKSPPPDKQVVLDRVRDSFLAEKVWHTSDPRDNVFILHGMHPTFNGLARLGAGYHNTVEQIFTYGTILLLYEGTWSRSCWCMPSQSPYLPSWVVDFSASKIHTLSDTRSITDDQLLHDSKFDACAGSDKRCEFATTPQALHTAAFLYDEIEAISTCLTITERRKESVLNSWKAWFDMLRHYDLERPLVAILRTICAGLALRYKRFAPEDALLFWNTPVGRAWQIPERPTSEGENNALQNWNTWIWSIARCKRFFVTKGVRMGLASDAAAVGDRIAIFASGRLPFVVRKVHVDTKLDAHILRGTCYLDGRISPTDVQASDGC
jgi:hypothetical protein